jgi:hypothetical protein
MTDYNDGKWHGWNGSAECPVHHLSEVQVGGETDNVWTAKRAGQEVAWSNVIVFRVTKPYREPREAWSVGAHLRDTEAEAIAFRAAVAADHGPHHLETPICHWREVLE